MKANARRVPGFTRSCRIPLSRSGTPGRRFQALPAKCVHYAYKMRPNFKTQISIHSSSTTYNFAPKKCTHFPDVFPVLTLDNQSLGTESHDAQSKRPVDCYSFSLGEKVRMRDKPVHSLRPSSVPTNFSQLYTTGKNGTNFIFHKNGSPRTNDLRRHLLQSSHFASSDCTESKGLALENRTNPDDFRFLRKPTTPYQRLTTSPRSVVRFCIEQFAGNQSNDNETEREWSPASLLPRGLERPWGRTLKEFTEGEGRRPSAWATRESLGWDEGQTSFSVLVGRFLGSRSPCSLTT
jgi:hypothetical protein